MSVAGSGKPIALFRCTRMVLCPKRAEICQTRRRVIQSRQRHDTMKLWFYGFFFFFPRPLAEGNG